MIVRMAKISLNDFVESVKHGLWGSKINSLSKWNPGDKLIFNVDRKLAAVAEVTGEAFKDETPLWGNGTFPYRIPIKFNCILKENDMIPFNDEIIGTLMEEWGFNYGWGIVTKRAMSKETANRLISMISEKVG